ncbi:RtcB family protein [soil metagenome]|nr:RtcB family protein [Actinomycetota bacterium]
MPNQPRPNVLSWASIVDDHTLDQAALSAELPFVRGPVVLMPDAHFGLGATIGSVIATDGAVVPAAVGVDIGCGMAALSVPMDNALLTQSALKDVLAQWVRRIPAGVGQGHDKETSPGERWLAENPYELDAKQRTKTIRQFGTLGSGNHFLELCLDENEGVWVLLHSGSRGVGNQLAQEFIKAAEGEIKRGQITLPHKDLAYLRQGTDLYDAYMRALDWAQRYAAANRQQMLFYAYDQLIRLFNLEAPFADLRQINCHHNYAVIENHGGKDVLLTRKGAIRARKGDLGLIPGSMGTASFIVRGLGNPLAYHSSPHGAGRAMSRGQARRQFTPDDLTAAMEGKTWRDDVAAKLVDEIPSAYKDIDQIMADSRDLVEIVHTLRQVANYKGL